MTRIEVALLLTLVGVPTVAASAQAKGVNDKHDQWNAVMALPAETDIEVQSVSGDVIRGHFQFASQVRLMVDADSHALDLPHSGVQSITVVGHRLIARDAWCGFLIGAGVGAVEELRAVKTNRGHWVAVMSAGEGSLGGIIGALHGAVTRERTMVYERRPSPSNAR